MSLRVTQGMINTQLMRNLNSNMRQLDKLSEQLASGRKINRPSDDPVGITYSLRYRSEIAANEQYQRNVDSALSWLDFTDDLAKQAGDIMHRVKELTVQGATGTNPQSALDSISSEMKQLRAQLVQVGNSQLTGKYVLNGQKFDQPPYTDANATTAMPDTGDVLYEVGTGSVLGINLTGSEIFGAPGEADQVFAMLDRITAALDSGDHEAVNAELGHIETRVEKLLSARADIGAKTNRVELMENRLADLNLNLTDLQSKTEDADFERIIIDSKIAENIYQASLSVGAKIIVPSLVDFLR